ncbi:MAG: acetate--CoA ligase family protein [Chloroflexota bacterium]|nr:acetate--CoA ligase family protein [Chloroflexota bacterium]
MPRDLRPLLAPSSIAIIGASSRPDSLSGRPLALLQQYKFPGALYPINPRHREIGGLRTHPTIRALREAPDMAVLILPGQGVMPALEECAQAGVRAAVIISSGFAEVRPEGAAEQERMRALAAESGMLVCGPNCMGVFNFIQGFCVSFAGHRDMTESRSGRTALICQSGAITAGVANRLFDVGVGVNYAIASGNEADVTTAELLEYFAADGATDSVVCITEEVHDGPRFLAACRQLLEAGKPAIMFKVGTSAVGNAAVRSHTGSLAGSYQVLQGVLRQFGVIEARDLEDIVDFAPIVASRRWPGGRNVAVVTVSGGAGAAAADSAEELGLGLPAFRPEVRQKLEAFLPDFIPPAETPLDVTAHISEHPGAITEIMRLLLAEDAVDAFMSINPGPGPPPERLEQFVAGMAGTTKPAIQVILGGSDSDANIAEFRRRGVPVYRSPAKALRSLAAVRRFVRGQELLHLRSPIPASIRETLADQLQAAGVHPTEYEAKRLLHSFGIPVIEERTAASAEDAAAAAEALGYPVALKVRSPEITHKTEAGGVRLKLTDAGQVREAFGAVRASAASFAPGAEIAGVVVSRMADVRLELIAGFHTDPTFGPVVVFGLGGMWAEVLRDVAMRAAPLGRPDVGEMVRELRGAELLKGARGLPVVPEKALEDILLAISDIAVAGQGELEGIDINPLAVTADGSLVALDASLFRAGPRLL